MKKLTALILTTTLLILLSFSVTPVSAAGSGADTAISEAAETVNPKTDDSMVVIAALLAASGTGLMVFSHKKEEKGG